MKRNEKFLKFRNTGTDFSLYQRDWEKFEQENTLVALNILFLSYNNERSKACIQINL